MSGPVHKIPVNVGSSEAQWPQSFPARKRVYFHICREGATSLWRQTFFPVTARNEWLMEILAQQGKNNLNTWYTCIKQMCCSLNCIQRGYFLISVACSFCRIFEKMQSIGFHRHEAPHLLLNTDYSSWEEDQ